MTSSETCIICGKPMDCFGEEEKEIIVNDGTAGKYILDRDDHESYICDVCLKAFFGED
jgi:hypothetical protein